MEPDDDPQELPQEPQEQEFVLLEDDTILHTEGFSFRCSSYRLLPEAPHRAHESILLELAPNDASVDPNSFTDIAVRFSWEGEHIEVPLSSTAIAFIPSEHGLAPGEYTTSVTVGGAQVGPTENHSRVTLLDPLEIDQETVACIPALITALSRKPSSSFSWLFPATEATPTPWPEDTDRLNASLRALLIGKANFTDGGGCKLDGQRLIIPEHPARKEEIIQRLKNARTDSDSACEGRVPKDESRSSQSCSLPCVALIPSVVLALLMLDPSCALLMMLVFYTSVRELFNGIEMVEEIWTSLDRRFWDWERIEPETSLEGLHLLLALDGPWRGEYEEACRTTKSTCCATSMRAHTAMVVVLTVWWSQTALFGSSIDELSAVAALQCWSMCALICWRAANISSRMTGQAGHLLKIHKRAALILSSEQVKLDVKCAEQVAGWQMARARWEMEYALVKEYTQVNQCGFLLLDIQVERRHLVAGVTVAVPAILRCIVDRGLFLQALLSVKGLSLAALVVLGMSTVFAHGSYLMLLQKNQITVLVAASSAAYVIFNPACTLMQVVQQLVGVSSLIA